MLKLRSIGIHDYSVLEGGQRIGRIRFAGERVPGIWIWNVVIHLPGGLPMGSAKDLDTAKAEFREAWEALKDRTTPERLAAAHEYSGRRLKAIRIPLAAPPSRLRKATLRYSAPASGNSRSSVRLTTSCKGVTHAVADLQTSRTRRER